MTGEPWLDRKKLADHYSCSVRSIELALADGMPHAVAFGRVKFQVSKVEPWLEEHGYIERRVDGPSSVVTGSDENGAATARTAPLHDREVESR
jgi:hypothetical protein